MKEPWSDLKRSFLDNAGGNQKRILGGILESISRETLEEIPKGFLEKSIEKSQKDSLKEYREKSLKKSWAKSLKLIQE